MSRCRCKDHVSHLWIVRSIHIIEHQYIIDHLCDTSFAIEDISPLVLLQRLTHITTRSFSQSRTPLSFLATCTLNRHSREWPSDWPTARGCLLSTACCRDPPSSTVHHCTVHCAAHNVQAIAPIQPRFQHFRVSRHSRQHCQLWATLSECSAIKRRHSHQFLQTADADH
jgi:hypothetical protein